MKSDAQHFDHNPVGDVPPVVGEVLTFFCELWQYECCGEPLVVGREADVVLKRPHVFINDWDQNVWGGVPFVEDHHELAGPVELNVRVRVRRLWEARSAMAVHRHHESGQMQPRQGARSATRARAIEVSRMKIPDDEWQPCPDGGEHAGWIVRAGVVAVNG